MAASEAFRCLDELDVEGMKKVHARVFPHLPIGSDETILKTLHIARTSCEKLAFWKRAYSHSWLEERNLPSRLPDHLKKRADRLYPRVVGAVGISINFKAPDLKPAGDMIQSAMSAEVEDCYADGRQEPDYVKPRMLEAGRSERRKLFGRWGV